MKCTAGTVYSNTTKTCDDCPIGFYRGQRDTKCEECPSGKTTETVGSTSSSECIGKTALPHKCHSSVTAVSQQCQSSATAVSQRCHSSVTRVSAHSHSFKCYMKNISNYSVALFQLRNTGKISFSLLLLHTRIYYKLLCEPTAPIASNRQKSS